MKQVQAPNLHVMAHLGLLVHLLLAVDIDGHLGAIHGLNETLEVASLVLAGVGDPHRLLGVIRLGLQLGLEVEGHGQPGGGVRVGARGLLDVAGHCGDTMLLLLRLIQYEKHRASEDPRTLPFLIYRHVWELLSAVWLRCGRMAAGYWVPAPRINIS